MEDRQACGLLIKSINDQLVKNLNNSLREYGLTGVQLQALLIISHAPDRTCSYKELERELHLAQSTTVGIAGRLELKGYVISYTDGEDHRVKRVRITEEGRRICDISDIQRDSAEDALQKALSPEDRVKLMEYLQKLWEALQE